jgi:phosphonate transport system permease protein
MASRWRLFLAASLFLAVGLCFWSLDLQWAALFAPESLRAMGRFLAEFFPLETGHAFLRKLAGASLETLAMSTLGTLLATAVAAVLCLPAARAADGRGVLWRAPARLLLNVLRSVPEIAWASLLLVAAGLGPMAGTLALALHTAGVLGRLFAEAIENAPPGPALALRVQGATAPQVLLYATVPLVAPQLLSYVLYRWENNIRVAAVLGIVGAGGLGQMLAFHLALFQMGRTGSVVAAMLVLVLLVDALSHVARRAMTRPG